MSDGYLSTAQAAAYLSTTPRGFDQYARRHGIPFKWYGRTRRFRVADLEKYALKTPSERDRERR